MVFSTIIFLLRFLPITLALYYLAPPKLKNTVLFLCSLVFYCWGEVRFFPVMLALILINYLCGLGLERFEQNKTARLILLLIALAGSLGMLFYFKYANFVLSSINAIFGTGFAPIQGISVLPLGISFYTFQTLSYTIDVYRGHVRPQRNLATFATFVCLFPQLIAGPIVRYSDIAPELRSRTHTLSDAAAGTRRFVLGLAKKILFANLLGELVSGFRASQEQSVLYFWLGAAAFTLQIYYDFSGYSDMAIGLGRILGFHFPENFRYPYCAGSITEFWRRWHISLGSWFRDYLYIPLGGNRKGKVRKYCNLMLTFLASGLWHGAAWTYVIWGGLHGLYQIIGDLLRPVRKKIVEIFDVRTDCISFKLTQIAFTFVLTTFAWIFFRADNLGQACVYISRIATRVNPWALFNGTLYTMGLEQFEANVLFFALFILLLVDLVRYRLGRRVDVFLQEQNIWFRWLVCLLLILLVSCMENTVRIMMRHSLYIFSSKEEHEENNERNDKTYGSLSAVCRSCSRDALWGLPPATF